MCVPVVGKSAHLSHRKTEGIAQDLQKYQMGQDHWATDCIVVQKAFCFGGKATVMTMGCWRTVKLFFFLDNCAAYPPADVLFTREVFATFAPQTVLTDPGHRLIDPWEILQGRIKHLKANDFQEMSS